MAQKKGGGRGRGRAGGMFDMYKGFFLKKTDWNLFFMKKTNIKSPYLENGFQQVAKLWGKSFSLTFLCNFIDKFSSILLCMMVNSPTSQV
jgi:hypothetical protein